MMLLISALGLRARAIPRRWAARSGVVQNITPAALTRRGKQPTSRQVRRATAKLNASGHSLSASILIVPAYPLHGEFEAALIAAFGHKVEELVDAIDHADPPPGAGIGVEHLASVILVADADSLLIRHINRPSLIVVVRLALGHLFGRKRHVIVEIEIAPAGRDPWAAPVGPFHALPGHRHAAARQRIALAREFLLGSEQLKARLQPFLVRNDYDSA